MRKNNHIAVAGVTGAVLFLSSLCVAQETQAHPPAAAAPAATQPAASGPAAKIELSMEKWEFGTVWEGDDIKTDVTIKNVGQAPLKLSPPRASCSCTAAKPEKDVLEPGQSTSVAVSVNSLKRKGDVHTVVTFTSNDPLKPELALQINGHVNPLMDLKPQTGITFGRISSGKETREVEIENMSGKPSKLELVPPGPEMAAFDVKFVEVEPGKKYKLVVETKPPLKEGSIQQNVVIKTGLEKLPELRVPVTGIVAPRVSISPPILNIPANSPRPQERALVVTYSADKPIKIKSMKVVGGDKITVEEAPLNTPKQGTDKFLYHNLKVKLPAGLEIPAEGATIEIETDDAEFAKLTVPVKRIEIPNRNRVVQTPTTQPGVTTLPAGRAPAGGPPGAGAKAPGAAPQPAKPNP